MNFRDKLRCISACVGFEMFISDHCEKIKVAMEEAAHAGYRTFQIDIVQPLMGQKVSEANAVNCYTITCEELQLRTKNATSAVKIARSIEAFLKQQGFEELADKNTFSNACWLTIVLKVEW